MIHFFPELSTLYHRTLIVSQSSATKQKLWKEWTQSLWKLSADKANFHTIDPIYHQSPIGGFACCHLGKRNKDSQKLLSFCSSLEEIGDQDSVFECADSVLVEVEPQNESSTRLFQWQTGPSWANTKVLWCLRSPFGAEPSLHEKALDKKLIEIAPESQRILWPNDQFIRDGLEWVLSF